MMHGLFFLIFNLYVYCFFTMYFCRNRLYTYSVILCVRQPAIVIRKAREMYIYICAG